MYVSMYQHCKLYSGWHLLSFVALMSSMSYSSKLTSSQTSSLRPTFQCPYFYSDVSVTRNDTGTFFPSVMLSQRLIIRHSKSVYSGVLGQWLCLFSPLKFADSRAKFSEIAGRVLFRSVTVRQLCECTNPSDYRKYFPGQVIRIRLKIEKNSRSFLYIFNSAVMNDLTMTFTSRFKMDAKCANQQCNRIRVADNFWTPPAD